MSAGRRDLAGLARAILRQAVPEAVPTWARQGVPATVEIAAGRLASLRGARAAGPAMPNRGAVEPLRPPTPPSPPTVRVPVPHTVPVVLARTRRYGVRLASGQHEFLMSFARRHGVPASAVSRSLLRLLEADPGLAQRLDIGGAEGRHRRGDESR